jgi:hypothetical protein
MNQTKKRLSIINLAISIGDIETIQLQMLKLAPLKSDGKIQEIIRGLQAENYAQTQALITTYIETPTEEIVQRASQHETLSPEEEEEIIEAFDLFKVEPEKEEKEIEEILDLESFQETPQSHQESETDVNYDALLNLKGEDILPDNIKIKEKGLTLQDDFFDEIPQEASFNYTQIVDKDDFFDTPEEETDTLPKEQLWERRNPEEALPKREEEPSTYTETPEEHTTEDAKEILSPNTPAEKLTTPPPTPTSDNVQQTSSRYAPITYIDQKLKNMMIQYPPLEIPEESYPSVNAWLLKISNEGYTEEEIEEMIAYIQKLAKEGRKAEAAQLLLISAATHSKYAQFMLARALFKGDLFEKNLPESFTLINRLALDDDYAEAICDLGQLYEYGIGIDKDMVRAEELYKEAMELGIQRAAAHYKRVHQANKSLFAKLFRR